MNRRQFIGGGVSIAALAALSRAGLAKADSIRPNILVIMTDDQDWASVNLPYTLANGKAPVHDSNGDAIKVWAMPYLRSNPHGKWVDYPAAYCPSAICAPSRGAFLTGQRPSNNGCLANFDHQALDESDMLPTWLRDAGYGEIILEGKYLGGKKDRYWPKPPGWTKFSTGGKLDSVSKAVLDHIDRLTRQDGRPWFIMASITDTHSPIRSSKYDGIDVIPPDRGSALNEDDVSDKPSWLRRLRKLSTSKLNRLRSEMVKSFRIAMEVDDFVEDAIEMLYERGQLDNTIVIFLSDNGQFYGQHRLENKDAIYEEAARVPTKIRWPFASDNIYERRVISHLDITATLVDVLGLSPDLSLDGTSMKHIINDPSHSWDSWAWIESHGRNRPGVVWDALRVGGDGYGYIYAKHTTGERELYDMANDPYQETNVAYDNDYAGIVEMMENAMAELA